MANLKIGTVKAGQRGVAWDADTEKEKLMLIHEKEELLKELQFVTRRGARRTQLESLEAERQRLEEELLAVRGRAQPGPGREVRSAPGPGPLHGPEISNAPALVDREPARATSHKSSKAHSPWAPCSSVIAENVKMPETDVE